MAVNPVMYVALEWGQAHCVIPDRHRKGEPFILFDHQVQYLANYYRVKRSAKFNPKNPPGADAFQYSRGILVEPQKKGKGPLSAFHICIEAVGPSQFAGWAQDGEYYDCLRDGGCGCGWQYFYEPGEPKGRLQPTPLIQIVAASEDQAGNIYKAFQPMVTHGPLNDLIPSVGMKTTRLANGGEIQVVTASAESRLGARVTAVFLDEVGTWTKENGMVKLANTLFRGLAGMDCRCSLTTNAWDPAQNSVAQQEYESATKDVLIQYNQPPTEWDFRVKADRLKIFAYVYGETVKSKGGHIELNTIEAEAMKFIKKGNWTEAARFFGNILTAAQGQWMTEEKWTIAGPKNNYWIAGPPKGTEVCGGFDGSLNNDWTAIKLVTKDGRVSTPRYGPDNRPTIWNPADWGGEIPRDQIEAAWDEIITKYNVARVYCDPGFNDETSWESDIEAWENKLGNGNDPKRKPIFISWSMTGSSRYTAVFAAIKRVEADLATGKLTHDGCPITKLHVTNAVKVARTAERYGLAKPEPHRKIDAAVTTVLAYEAAADCHADNAWPKPKKRTRLYTGSSTRRR